MHILYCERQNTQFFFEPLNTISNVAFFVAAYYAQKYINENRVKDNTLKILPYLISSIGVGSFLFHSFRNQFTNYLDVIPIYLFIVFSFYIALQKLVKNKISIYILISIFGFVQLTAYFTLLNYLYGSTNYIITITALIMLATAIYKNYGKQLLKSFVIFIGVFSLGLLFRTLDFVICSYIPIGTHYLWHMLIALTTYLGVRFLVQLDKVSSNRNMA